MRYKDEHTSKSQEFISMDEIFAIVERFKEIPFGQSEFQNKNFVIGDKPTKARKFRSIGLELQSRIKAYMEVYYEEQRINVELKKLKTKLETDIDDFERELVEIDIEEKTFQRIFKAKAIRDSMKEIAFFKKELDNFDEISEAEFEKEELEYFTSKFKDQLDPRSTPQKLLDRINPSVSGSIENKTAQELLKEGFYE